MDVDKNDQNVQAVQEDTDVKELTSVEVTKERANSGDIESGKENPNEEERSCKQRLIDWLPVIVGISIVLIIAIIAICCSFTVASDGENDDSYTTHGYRFPNTSFDDCCANRKNRRTYLEACNNILKKDDIECVEVIRGSAIIITKSANPDHKNIICDKFAKIKNLNKHSTEKGYHMSEKEVNEHKDKLEKKDQIAKLESQIESLKTTVQDYEKLNKEHTETIEQKDKIILQLEEKHTETIEQKDKIIRELEEKHTLDIEKKDAFISQLEEKQDTIIDELKKNYNALKEQNTKEDANTELAKDLNELESAANIQDTEVIGLKDDLSTQLKAKVEQTAPHGPRKIYKQDKDANNNTSINKARKAIRDKLEKENANDPLKEYDNNTSINKARKAIRDKLEKENNY